MGVHKISSNAQTDYQFRKAILTFSFACWLVSLALPSLISPMSKNSLWGMEILLMGWLGVAGVEDGVNLLGVLAWWANPFYLWAIINIISKGKTPEFSAKMAFSLAPLTVLVDSYALNAVPTFTSVIGYGPGALLWYLAILSLAYVVVRDAGYVSSKKLIVYPVCVLCLGYAIQLAWRVANANETEKERLPIYAAKRGLVCSVEQTKLPITEQQPTIGLETYSQKEWLDALRNWQVTAIQIGSTEYRRVEEGSPESRKPPYMTNQPVTIPARYTLHVEGGYPYVNKWSDGGLDYVRLIMVDNQTKVKIGQLVFYREMNRKLGFCPSLTNFPYSRNEEAIRWLAPFISPR